MSVAKFLRKGNRPVLLTQQSTGFSIQELKRSIGQAFLFRYNEQTELVFIK